MRIGIRAGSRPFDRAARLGECWYGNADLTPDLADANLRDANLADADLADANLTGANLKSATGMTSATLTGVTWDRTNCPDNTDSNKDGGTCLSDLTP